MKYNVKNNITFSSRIRPSDYTKHHTGSHPYDKKRRVGCVYIITNPAWPEWVKIGVALDSKKRVKGFNTGSPFRDYKVEYVLETINRHTVEIIAHKKAEEISKDHNSEWFKMSVEDAKNILDNIKGA